MMGFSFVKNFTFLHFYSCEINHNVNVFICEINHNESSFTCENIHNVSHSFIVKKFTKKKGTLFLVKKFTMKALHMSRTFM